MHRSIRLKMFRYWTAFAR